MASVKNYLNEITISIIAFIWLWFVLTNSNVNLGNAYLWAIGISLFLLLINVLVFDKSVRVTFQKQEGHWFEAIFAGLVGWVAILLISFLVFKFVDPLKANLGAIMSSMGAANPAFSNSKIVNWLTISFAIGFGETMLFGRLLEFAADRFKIPITRATIMRFGFIALALSLALLFAIFHITAKGVASTSSLVVVAIMMIISLFMIAYYNGETRQAVIMHVVSNGVAGYLALMAGGLIFG